MARGGRPRQKAAAEKYLDTAAADTSACQHMYTLRSRSLVALLLFTCLSLAGARTSRDGKVKFPADEPTFTIEFPAGWTYQPDKDGNLDCDPGDDSGYAFSIVTLDNVTSDKELRATLPKLAKAMAESAKLKEFEVGDVEKDKNGNGISFLGLRGDGKTEGIDFMVMVHAFEPKKGSYYAIVTAGSREADKKHEKAYDAITASIERFEG